MLGLSKKITLKIESYPKEQQFKLEVQLGFLMFSMLESQILAKKD